MEKYYYNSENGLWYELQGDYYIPYLTLGETEKQPIGMWGRKHLRYLKEHRSVRYTTLISKIYHRVMATGIAIWGENKVLSLFLKCIKCNREFGQLKMECDAGFPSNQCQFPWNMRNKEFLWPKLLESQSNASCKWGGVTI